jgi:hypothetical protein
VSFGPRTGKYNAKPVRDGGRFYASTAEHDYHAELKLREEAGDVRAIVVQPSVELVAGIKYRPDYRFEERGLSRERWRTVWVDVKGCVTREFLLKLRLWREFGPGPLRIVQRKGRRAAFMTTREVLPKPNANGTAVRDQGAA